MTQLIRCISSVTNNRNKIVGTIIEEDNILKYLTERDLKKGQIFIRKTCFEGKHIENGVAIDVAILKKLLAGNVKVIKYVIRNFEKYTFFAEIDIYDFLKESMIINYDKIVEDRKEFNTRYGEQRVISLDRCRRVDNRQKVLEVFENVKRI